MYKSIKFFFISLVLPVILFPIELVLPYPYLVEEIAIFFLVTFFLKNKETIKKEEWKCLIMFGALFTLSESMLYLFNIMKIGRYSDLGERLITTGLLHIATFSIIAYSFKTKKVINTYLGLGLAILIHYLFNIYIVKLIPY